MRSFNQLITFLIFVWKYKKKLIFEQIALRKYIQRCKSYSINQNCDRKISKKSPRETFRRNKLQSKISDFFNLIYFYFSLIFICINLLQPSTLFHDESNWIMSQGSFKMKIFYETVLQLNILWDCYDKLIPIIPEMISSDLLIHRWLNDASMQQRIQRGSGNIIIWFHFRSFPFKFSK